MLDISQALARLGLESNADAKGVRRAYARALKELDQEAGIPAFQSLREAYELALGSQPADKPMMAPSVTENESQEAFEWMVAAVAVISGGRRIADETIWVDALREQLAEQQPVGIDAGWRLETAIGRLLIKGWQPGHEALLIAATEYFGWAEHGRWPNAQLAEAWFELWLLHRQPELLRAPLVRVIRDLRQSHEPDSGRLRRDHGYFEHLATHFANLTPVIVDERMLQRWRHLAAPLGTAPDVSWTPIKDTESSRAGEILRTVLMLIAALFLVWLQVGRMFHHA